MSQVDLIAVQNLFRIGHLCPSRPRPHLAWKTSRNCRSSSSQCSLKPLRHVSTTTRPASTPTSMGSAQGLELEMMSSSSTWAQHLSETSLTAWSSRIALARRESHSGLGSYSHPSEGEAETVTRME